MPTRPAMLGALFAGLLVTGPDVVAREVESSLTSPRPKIVAYVTSWSPPVSVDTRVVTHVNYAFATIDARGTIIVLPPGAAHARLQELLTVRRAHPDLRVLVSVGGWGAEGFSDAALTEGSRGRFARSAVDLVRRYELDGIDLDWEYPGQAVAGIKARPADRENFTRLLHAVREALDHAGQPAGRSMDDAYLLTIATADREYFKHVEMDRVHRHVDWVNVMAYDFYNSLTPTTGHHAGLHRASSAPPTDRWASSSIEQHLAAGVPRHKLVLGVAFYGRRFEGVAPDRHGLNQPYARYGGEHSYRELQARFIDRGGFERHWDRQAGAPWLWNSTTLSFVSYEDPDSLRLKTHFARNLAGVMFWELSQDSPDGALLAAIAEGLGVARGVAGRGRPLPGTP